MLWIISKGGLFFMQVMVGAMKWGQGGACRKGIRLMMIGYPRSVRIDCPGRQTMMGRIQRQEWA